MPHDTKEHQQSGPGSREQSGKDNPTTTRLKRKASRAAKNSPDNRRQRRTFTTKSGNNKIGKREPTKPPRFLARRWKPPSFLAGMGISIRAWRVYFRGGISASLRGRHLQCWRNPALDNIAFCFVTLDEIMHFFRKIAVLFGDVNFKPLFVLTLELYGQYFSEFCDGQDGSKPITGVYLTAPV